ncbi:MAG: 30S ribosomal protein S12 methylthiotransferase RimO [Clostridiales bacterium]|nr:30S ribosomal protein S12 methylthiotransferase RimO [Clostridiales bacterium]
MGNFLKVYIKTLGCDKNGVDSDNLAALLLREGHGIVQNLQDADLIILNSCAFIEDAKKESIDAFFELSNSRKSGAKMVLAGCLAQRYSQELSEELPEADFIVGINEYENFVYALSESPQRLLTGACGLEYMELPRHFEGGASAYIKIAEGCSNVCSYCAIPYIRGRYRSRKSENVLAEARMLASQGVKELIVIAQNITSYGRDLDLGVNLSRLLRELCKIEGLEWIRLMYCYEDEITDELIETIKNEDKICKYIDIPVQHCSRRILEAMNRKSTPESIRSTIKKLRKHIPGISIRTTMIVGFPGESAEEFEELCDFVSEMRFERLGVFEYSREEGTLAADLPHQIAKETKRRRKDRIMRLQQAISLENNEKYIGKTLKVLVEERFEDGSYEGRSEFDAPEIDNAVLFTSKKALEPGCFVPVKINDAFDYDLTGEYYEPSK